MIFFAPVVGLLCAHCHARTSTERERQRKVGQPVRPCVFIVKTTMFTAACASVPPLCIVFLDFRSRSARSRSATFKRSSARQSARRLPHRALCALRRITAYLHKPYRKPVYVMRGKIICNFLFLVSAAGFLWILLTACVSVPSFLAWAYVSRRVWRGFRGFY